MHKRHEQYKLLKLELDSVTAEWNKAFKANAAEETLIALESQMDSLSMKIYAILMEVRDKLGYDKTYRAVGQNNSIYFYSDFGPAIQHKWEDL